jgi:hypothetical protein
MSTNRSPLYLRFGGADKSLSDMNEKDIEKAAQSILRRAKEKAFFKGRPIVFSEQGKIFEEWADGHVDEVTK